jgi:hypothetical protein
LIEVQAEPVVREFQTAAAAYAWVFAEALRPSMSRIDA